ncbi:MAG TPA: CHAT domain-containing protein [Chitinophagaceae bacterium]|jgi:CHAT domain-containing protein|nr:CHAT domain-containing protein [Chitinophagaceae bacterium]
MIPAISKQLALACLLYFLPVIVHAQTQDDFNNKLSDVYTNAADKKKALTIAKELYTMVEKKKDLQTYANYYLLKTIFEAQAPDAVLAKTSGEKATKILNGAVGTASVGDTTANPFNQWYYVIYPGLFSNSDPDIASKAVAFIDRYPEYKNFDSYYYIAFAFERKGDFTGARQNYEKALSLDTGGKDVYHTYLFYTNFLSKSGDYLKAEEYIRKMDQQSLTGSEMFRNSYKAEAMGAKVVYYLNIGDYKSYIEAAEKNNAYSSELWHKNNPNPCDPYPGIHFTTSAYGKEMLREYDAAERLWKSRDSVNYIWVNCHNKTYPNNQYFPVSMYPVYLIKRGKFSKLPKPASFFINETEAHYNSYSQYADISVNFMKATQLAFLGSPRYPEIFKPLMEQVKNNRNFRESTTPFANYAYFSMRDKKMEEARKTYADLFRINVDWMNDIIFSFGERAFATYYNSKLKEGYDNYHSFVRIAKEKQPALFPELAQQAYNNLLFTKSISLKGTQRRKDAFLNANDPTITRLYEQWIGKKQQLIRQYLKTDSPSGPDTANKLNQEFLQKLQDEVSQLENELTDKAKDFKKYLKLPAPDWKQVRDQLKDGEAAIEIIKFQWRDQVYYSDTVYYAAYIITKTSQHPEVVYLPATAADLDNKYYKAYKNYVKLKIEDKESYDHYWKPIAEKLSAVSGGSGIKKIYFSPDGIYHLINISTLKNLESNRFLLDEMEVQYTVSGTDINNDPAKDIRTAVLMGRPSYKTDEAISTGTAIKPATRSFVNNFKNQVIPDLPGTEEEVMSIKKEMDQNKFAVSYYLKDQATEDKLYKLHSPGILHIATHGYWSAAGETATEGYRVFNAMANSGLLLSGVTNYYTSGVYPDTYDGILTAYEAQNLDLENTALVILSACETSLGAMDAGEGIYGLQRAFRAAGAESVITSLWKVDDMATKDFMIAFYQHYLKTKDKLAAFSIAQKAIREKYIHPYYWGAFVMMGE